MAISSRVRMCRPTMRANDAGPLSRSRTSTRTSCSLSSAANTAPVGPQPTMITSWTVSLMRSWGSLAGENLVTGPAQRCQAF